MLIRILCCLALFLTILSIWGYAIPYIVNVLASANLSSLDENKTSNKTGTNETIVSLTNRTAGNFTQNQNSSAPEDTEPITQNNVDWTNIAAVFGSAIAGAFSGSLLQLLLSSRYNRKKEHLADLKEKVAKPLYEHITNPNFGIRVAEFQFVDEAKGGKFTSDDILFDDFMENHYPDIHANYKEFMESKIDYDRAEHDLRNKLTSSFKPVMESMKAEYNDSVNNFNGDWIDTLVGAIVNRTYAISVSAVVKKGHVESYFHIADNAGNKYLYFYHEKDDMVPFRLSSTERPKFVIFESTSSDWKHNVEKTTEVRDKLIQIIDKALNERNEEVKKYEESKLKYFRLRKELADKLLTVTYSTRLKFKQSDPNKKCSLT